MYDYLKSLHLIFVITWFAGLFYIVRLFIYQIEAYHKPSPDKEILGKQLKIMAKRLWYIITWPSMILALGFGTWVLIINWAWVTTDWMQVKLGFVVLLVIYHIKCQLIFRQLQEDVVKYTSNFMRLFNEGATIILFAVTFIIILKNAVNWIYGTVGIILFSILIVLGFKLYKRLREKK